MAGDDDLVAVDVDYTGQTGYVGSGASAAYVRSAASVASDMNYIRRVTLNVGRVVAIDMPDLQGKLSPQLQSLLDDQGVQNLDHPAVGQSYTVAQALSAVSWLIGKKLRPISYPVIPGNPSMLSAFFSFQ